MSGIFFSLGLELRYRTVLPRRVNSDPYQSVYTSNIDLDGSRMTVMITMPVSPETTYPCGTRVQVMGLADVVGDTIFMRTGSAVFPSDEPRQNGPFISFRASVIRWYRGAFDATIAGGIKWPSLVRVCCSYDPESDHLRNVKNAPPSAHVLVTGSLFRVDCGILEVKVHDLSFDGEPLPCNAVCLAHSSMAPAKLRAICHWFKTYRSSVESAGGHEANAQAGAICGIDPSPGIGQHDLPCANSQPVESPTFTAEDGSMIQRLLDNAIAARRNSLRARAQITNPTTAASIMPPVAVATDENLRPSPSHPDVTADVGEHIVVASNHAPTASTPTAILASDAVSTPIVSSYEVHRVPGRTADVVFAIRQALSSAFAAREEGPIGQTPVGWDGVHDICTDSKPESRDSQSPSISNVAVSNADVLSLAVTTGAQEVVPPDHAGGGGAVLPSMERVYAAMARTEASLTKAHDMAQEIICKF